MSFLLTITAIMTLCLLRPSYRQLESGSYRIGQTIGMVVFLAGYLGFSWVGALAWDNRLPDYMTVGPMGVVSGIAVVMLFGALFVAPSIVGALVAQALAGAYWAVQTRRTPKGPSEPRHPSPPSTATRQGPAFGRRRPAPP